MCTDTFNRRYGMTNRAFLVLLVIVGLCFARENYNGFLDTVGVVDTLDSAATSYTHAYLLSEFEDIRLIVKCDDTTTAGFADDTVSIFYGYQTGNVVLNSSGLRDTIYDDPITLDTMLSSEFGVVGSGTTSASGVVTRTWGGADTSSVTGYAVQSRWFVPEWDYLIRFWVTATEDNNQNTPLELYLEPKRRIFIPTR